MWIGVKTPLHHVTWDILRHTWQLADACESIASAWVFDHLGPAWGDPAGPCLEAWTSLSALSASTSRLRLGTMCSPIVFRHPFLLAQMAATVQQTSHGRLAVGIGTGSKSWESDGLGLDDGSAGARADRLEDGVALIKAAMATAGPLDYSGPFYEVHTRGGVLPTLGGWPRPEIVIGGRRDSVLRVAAAADHWNFPRGSPGEFVDARHRLVQYAHRLGRPAPTCSAHTVWESHSGDQLSAELHAWEAAGADGVIVALPAPWEPDEVLGLAAAAAGFVL